MMALDPITGVLEIGSKLIDKFFPDKAQADAAKLELLRMQQNGELAQITVNQEEAKNPRLFVSGWRPFIGWTCGTACAWNWIGLPVVKALFVIFTARKLELAPADLTEMLPILMGLLGLGGLRTIERLNGKA